MESAAITSLGQAFNALRADYGEETTASLRVLLANLQTARDTIVRTDETIAADINTR